MGGLVGSKPKSKPQPVVPEPPPVPEADPNVLERDEKRRRANQQGRSATRASTILSDNSSDTLG